MSVHGHSPRPEARAPVTYQHEPLVATERRAGKPCPQDVGQGGR